MHKQRVGVLRGGTSSEYDVSLKTGQSVLSNLPEEKYLPVDMLVTKDGTWHINGMPADVRKVALKVDVVFNALHGEYGEDGKVQKELDAFHIPYTGSGALASSLGMNKVLAKRRFIEAGLLTPRYELIEGKESTLLWNEITPRAREIGFKIFYDIPPPWVAKPVTGGSSVGVTMIREFSELMERIEKALENGENILIEECLTGKEATCGVVENFRDAKNYALLPVEIRPRSGKFYDYEAKYVDDTELVCPGNFSKEESEKLQQYAQVAHRSLGAAHYSRSDFFVTPRGIYILELNTLPGLTDHSLIPQSLRTVGSSLPEFLDHILSLAVSRK